MKVGTKVCVVDTPYDRLNGMLGAINAVDARVNRSNAGRRQRKKTWYYVQLFNVNDEVRSLLGGIILADPDLGIVWLSSDNVKEWHPAHGKPRAQKLSINYVTGRNPE